jgi:hypothetical protein
LKSAVTSELRYRLFFDSLPFGLAEEARCYVRATHEPKRVLGT